jgi:hypothetical protein
MGASGKQASRSPLRIGGAALLSRLNGFIVSLRFPRLG